MRLLLFVPTYNCEGFIGKVVQQASAKWCEQLEEIIILDNGSQDGTVAEASSALSKIKIRGQYIEMPQMCLWEDHTK